MVKQCTFYFQPKNEKVNANKKNADKVLKWAAEKVSWEKIIDSDGKKFNIVGPDAWCRYWCDLRDDQKTLCKRHTGGGGVMVWGVFSNLRQVCLTFCSIKMDQDE